MAEAENKDKFLLQKEQLNKEMHFIKGKLQEREKKSSSDVLEINMEIKEKFESIFNTLDRMKEAVDIEKTANVMLMIT